MRLLRVLPCTALALCWAALVACGPPADTEPPPTPTGLTVYAGSSSSAHVMWDMAPERDGVSAYEVYRDGARVREVPATKHMVDVAGLTPATEYRFAVRARDAAGNLSPLSVGVSATTRAHAPRDTGPPTRPARLTGKAVGARAAELFWGKAEDDVAVTAYDVYQAGVRIHTVDGRQSHTRITGLRPDTVYTFTVRARDAAEQSSTDSPAVDITTATASGQGPSTAVAGFEATMRPGADGAVVELSWLPPRTQGEVRAYELYSGDRLMTTVHWGEGAAPKGRATYLITVTEPPGTVWKLKLRARLPDGTWGSFSAVRTITLGGS
ncbi:fibronectin type III domain-containing protein [Streptomyces sp. NPDC006879]|uniref:fibronectin type III domain-containing protein n=1 Tax=Streptomyces sp. NPDC006879 TaxID=3364767 RepID=UPI0036C510DA